MSDEALLDDWVELLDDLVELLEDFAVLNETEELLFDIRLELDVRLLVTELTFDFEELVATVEETDESGVDDERDEANERVNELPIDDGDKAAELTADSGAFDSELPPTPHAEIIETSPAAPKTFNTVL
jgi:hypothetical protein